MPARTYSPIYAVIDNPQNGDHLVYNSATERWENTVSGSDANGIFDVVNDGGTVPSAFTINLTDTIEFLGGKINMNVSGFSGNYTHRFYSNGTSIHGIEIVHNSTSIFTGNAVTISNIGTTATQNVALKLTATGVGTNTALDVAAGDVVLRAGVKILMNTSATTGDINMMSSAANNRMIHTLNAAGTANPFTLWETASGDGKIELENTSNTTQFSVDAGGDAFFLAGNFGLNTSSFGASADGSFAFGNSTTPTSQPANIFQQWATDASGAGTASPHFLTEDGTTIILAAVSQMVGLNLTGAMTVSTVDGIDINPGSDIDTDIITVGVTGNPRLYWDESEHGLAITSSTTANLLLVGGAITEIRFFDGVTENATIHAQTNNLAFHVSGSNIMRLYGNGEIKINNGGETDPAILGDTFSMWAADAGGAGTCSPHFKTEDGFISVIHPIYGEAHVQGNGSATSIGTVNTPVKVVGTTSAGETNLFTHTNGRLTSNVLLAKTYRVTASLTLTSAVANKKYTVYIAKGGSALAKTGISRHVATTTDTGAITVSGLVPLALGEYVELFIENNTDTTNPTIEDYNLCVG